MSTSSRSIEYPIQVALNEFQADIVDIPEGYYLDKQQVYDKTNKPIASSDPRMSRVLDYINYGPVNGLDVKQQRFYSNTKGLPGYYAWCGAFVSFCYRGFYQGDRRKWASTSALFADAEKLRWTVPLAQMQPGDIIGVGKGTARHLGLYYTTHQGIIYTIEGNTVFQGREGVCMRTRVIGNSSKDGILKACRPPMLVT